MNILWRPESEMCGGDAFTYGVFGEFGDARNTELIHEFPTGGIGRLGTDMELKRNLLDRIALNRELENLSLANGQFGLLVLCLMRIL